MLKKKKYTQRKPVISKPTICLNMIVKNESHVIERSLVSAAPFIDYWVISDTGSTDGTQDIIRNFFAKQQIEGILREDAWQDFSHNRNLALKDALGKTDYIIILDADDYFDTPKGFRFRNLSEDMYRLKMFRLDIDYYVPKLIRGDLPWQWYGVLHEYLQLKQTKPYSCVNYQGSCQIISTPEGARSQNPDKYKADAAILEQAVLNEPDNSRYRFYLAQSYRDSGEYEKSLASYQICAAMSQWEEEHFYSLFEIARNKQRLGHDLMDVINAFMQAWQFRPRRIEPLFEAIRLCRINGLFHLGYQLGWDARHAKQPNDTLFIEKPVYEWMFLDELSICAAYTSNAKQSAEMMEKLIQSPLTPSDQIERIKANYLFAQSQIYHKKT